MKYFRRTFLKKSFWGILGIVTIGTKMLRENKKTKKVKYTYSNDQKHWVGDGFYVHGLLRPSENLNKFISPFILMDYASPFKFEKTAHPKGVGEHPHRGFETVTFAYQGEVEHRDSSGGGGIIKPGDVQWMTAGRGVVHDEFHSKEFSNEGGIFEMVQLWVNLPKKYKMTQPKYQEVKNNTIPLVNISENVKMRVIAGSYVNTKGPASTFSPINIYEIENKRSESVSISLKEKTNTVLLIMRGSLETESKNIKEKSIIIFDQEGESIDFKASSDFKALILNGEPIDEPVVAHGPFVMNTREEISQAIKDFQNGKMGNIMVNN